MCVVEDENGETSVEARLPRRARAAYDRLLRAFVRPPRATYDAAQLGPARFEFGGSSYARPSGHLARWV